MHKKRGTPRKKRKAFMASVTLLACAFWRYSH